MGLDSLMPETVAVVIPTFNSSVTIERALESVVGQTCLPTEVIVIDNASADDTVARVRTFASKYPRITWVIEVSPTNIGPGAARNRGWNLAKSDLIAFLDSDDSWHPEKLRLQGEIVRMFPESVLFGHRYLILRPDEVAPRDVDERSTKVIDRFELHHFLIRNRLSTPTVMVRREITQRFPIDFWYGYGESGLSANMAQMHRGEILAMKRLRQTGDIGMLGSSLTTAWMKVKYMRRRMELARRV
ncbi:MAG: glycosyltransferase family 2 protein [Actinobacteria bacterium]|nr:glycosyltransferase family 2 protein [Actinomycetota bacterium]